MSKVRKLIGLDSAPFDIEIERAKFGMYSEVDTSLVISGLEKINRGGEYCETGSYKGADLAIAAIELIRGDREPKNCETVDGTRLVKPIEFELGSCGLAGFQFMLDNYITLVRDIHVFPTDLNRLSKNKVYATALREDAFSSIVAIPGKILNENGQIGQRIDSDTISLAFDLPERRLPKEFRANQLGVLA